MVALLAWTKFDFGSSQPEVTINSSAILSEIETMGKLELVKYNFKEITEVEELSKKYLNVFQLGPDSRIALISEGQAVGCIDLSKVAEEHILIEGDTIFIQLPKPELCYYKLDMDKTRIYSLQTNPLKDEKAFIQKAYKSAEADIKKAALDAGILAQTITNAEIILKPMLERMSGRQVVFTKRPEGESIRLD